jgi:dihydroorotate dehydrogenase (NAD+) catalytic subunit
MLHKPFFDPEKTYEENFSEGPFGAFADGKVFKEPGTPEYTVLGQKVYTPFGIPAGPLLNGKYVKAALDKAFDMPVYKTVRTKKYPCNPWPNVLSVQVKGDLTLEQADKGVVANHTYTEPISITNSFGVPSFDPDFWQKDMKEAVEYAKKGQVVIGSFQGTTNANGNVDAYVQDFVDAAKLVKETGAKILEINLSCPNEGTAHLLCFDLERTAKVASAVKNAVGNTPVVIKIAYFKEQEQLKKLLTLVGKVVDGIAAINTIPAKIYDENGNQALPGNNRLVSGTCGYPIKWAGENMVERLTKLKEEMNFNFDIIGVGGVTNVQDYEEYRKLGADAVMSATGAMWNPFLAQEIKEQK